MIDPAKSLPNNWSWPSPPQAVDLPELSRCYKIVLHMGVDNLTGKGI